MLHHLGRGDYPQESEEVLDVIGLLRVKLGGPESVNALFTFFSISLGVSLR